MTALPVRASRFSSFTLFGVALFGLVLLWSYWPTLAAMVRRWAEDPQYSHGWLVPVFALYMLWQTRTKFAGQKFQVNALGLVLVAAAVGMRLAGAHYHFDYIDQVSLLPCLAGLFMLLGSWPALFWALPAVAFLAFMVPLPHTVSLAMSGPMQAFATTVSTFFLQLLGRPALAEGNVILLNDIELGIVEACSGLRMLVVFFALSTAISLLIRKPLWEKLLIAASAIPIALASNILRITVMGLFYDAFGNHFGGAFFHDLGGWLMMPVGLVFLGVELWVLRTLLVEPGRRALASSQVVLPSPVALNPVSLYRGSVSSRRDKAAAARAAAASKKPAPMPIDAEPVAGV